MEQGIKIKFDKAGLVPAVIQDFFTGEVLMLGYMNDESLAITLEEKRTCFYSRSRQELWRKGETSGNVQHVMSVKADCDADSLVIKVVKDGPACHTGAESCFFQTIYKDEDKQKFTIEILYQLILERKKNIQEGSYTSYLFSKGIEKISKKVGEESTEVVIAAIKQDKREMVFEISDLCYHILVLMAECGISTEEILAELESRHVVDNKVKQETLQ